MCVPDGLWVRSHTHSAKSIVGDQCSMLFMGIMPTHVHTTDASQEATSQRAIPHCHQFHYLCIHCPSLVHMLLLCDSICSWQNLCLHMWRFQSPFLWLTTVMGKRAHQEDSALHQEDSAPQQPGVIRVAISLVIDGKRYKRDVHVRREELAAQVRESWEVMKPEINTREMLCVFLCDFAPIICEV